MPQMQRGSKLPGVITPRGLGLLGGGGLYPKPGGLTFPASLNPLLWLKGSSGTFQDASLTTPASSDNDPVGGWMGIPPGNKTVTQATADSRPLLKTNVVNGRPVIRFDGVDDFLEYTSSLVTAQPVHIMAVLKQITWTSAERIWDGATTDKCVLAQLTSEPQLQIYAGVGFVAGNGNLAVDAFGIVEVLYSGASSRIRVNDETATTGNPGTNALDDGITLGSKFDGSGAANVDVAELFVFGYELSASQVTALKAYLNAEYTIF